MSVNKKRLVYFEFWLDPIAEQILRAREDIELVRLALSADDSENWSEMSRAVGYQVLPRTELRSPWFGDSGLIERSPNLLAMSSTGAGYDVIDVEACTRAGIIVCNQSGTNSEAVAEHAVGLMLSLAKKIALLSRIIAREPDVDRFAFVGGELQGKTVGIIGLGNIGSRVAEICRVAFRTEVLAYDPYLTDEQIQGRGARKVSLHELLDQSDFVSVHCPRSEETLGMIGAAQLERMRPSAYFINTARGGIHRESDLIEALQTGRIAGAGIDVFDTEPPAPQHPLLNMDNVIATPHCAGVTAESMRNSAAAAAQQWLTLLDGGVPPRLVNPEAWPRYRERFADIIGFTPPQLGDGDHLASRDGPRHANS
ncbi:MAG: hydroxyacid dehydrogenase [Gammaproteobacteria bacterium]|nr:hydroxyacid dehydrogenase [Gammaproteobacteria bacterium]